MALGFPLCEFLPFYLLPFLLPKKTSGNIPSFAWLSNVLCLVLQVERRGPGLPCVSRVSLAMLHEDLPARAQERTESRVLRSLDFQRCQMALCPGLIKVWPLRVASQLLRFGLVCNQDFFLRITAAPSHTLGLKPPPTRWVCFPPQTRLMHSH